jgi:hypothetical protein
MTTDPNSIMKKVAMRIMRNSTSTNGRESRRKRANGDGGILPEET